MHRQRTRLAARVNRVASAIERRGIVATYELHDRVLSNRRSRRKYAGAQPALSPTQQRIVGELDEHGYATVPFGELFSGDESLWNEIEQHATRFVSETENGLSQEGEGGAAEGLRRRAGKEFLVRAYSFDGARFGLDEPWFRAAVSSPVLDIANAYLRLWAKISYVDLWYSIPQPAESERVASQTWHYDFDDRHLLKAFLYLTDVDESTGPFEYVAGSQPGGKYHSVRPWEPMGYGRVPEQEVTGRVPDEAVRTFTAPTGTIVFCNTSGLHRGGFATGRPRVLATATYCSPASLRALSQRNFELEPGAAAGLGAAARHAVS